MRILIQYPSRSRSQKFAQGLETIRNLAVMKDDLLVHVVLDTDDPTLDLYMPELARLDDVPYLICFGKSTSKIDAINRPLPDVDWDILLTFSDDMRFITYGWDVLVRDQFRTSRDLFVHFFEKDSGDRVSVMDIVGKDYYARDRFIYNPDYLSLFCDEEKTEIARLRGKYVFVDIPIFRHDNPAVTGGEQDAMLKEQQAIGWSVDHATFLARKSKNFGL